MTTSFTQEERLSYLERYGSHCLAYATLQPGVSYCDVPGKGYLAYREYRGTRYVLSDPLCAEQDILPLIRYALTEHQRMCFVQARQPTAEALCRTYGFYATQMGVETIIDVSMFTLSGRQKQVIRTARNQAHKSGIMIHEATNACPHAIAEISRAWLATRTVNTREMTFLVRPLHLPYELGVRKWFAYKDGRPIGYVLFDPMYSNKQPVAYTPSVSRATSDFGHGLYYAVMAAALEEFKREGIKGINLGLSPLVLTSDAGPWESRGTKRLLKFLHDAGNRLYHFRGMEFAKSRFGGSRVPTYVIHRDYCALKDLFAVLKLCGVI